MTRGGWARECAGVFFLGVAAWVLLSGVSKLQDLSMFERALRSHDVLAAVWVRPAVIGVPSIELAVGVFAVFAALTPRVRWAAWSLGVLMLALTAYVGLVWLNPPPAGTTCGCGISNAPVESWGLIVSRNAMLASLLIAIGLMVGRSAHTEPEASTR